MTTRKRYQCKFCGLILNAWLPAAKAINGTPLLQHLMESHRAESRPYVARMRTHDDIGPIAAEAFEVIEGEDSGDGATMRNINAGECIIREERNVCPVDQSIGSQAPMPGEGHI